MNDQVPEERPSIFDSQTRSVLLIAILGFVVMGVGAFCLGIYPNMVRRAEQARREQMRANLKQIGIALHNYHQAQPSQNENAAPEGK